MKLLTIPKLQHISLANLWSNIYPYFLFIFVSAVVFFGCIAFDQYFRLRRIFLYTVGDQEPKLNTISHVSLFFSSDKQIQENILSSNPLIQHIDIRKQYPHTLILSISWHRPVAALSQKEGYIYLSREGVVTEKISNEKSVALPIMSYYQQFPFVQLSPGSRIPAQDVRQALLFLVYLQKKGVPIQRVDIQGFHMIGLYSADREFVFNAEKEYALQIYHLDETIKLLKRQGKQYKKIDVRFDKPVIVL